MSEYTLPKSPPLRGDESRDHIYKQYLAKRRADRAHLGEPPTSWEELEALPTEARFKALYLMIEELTDILRRIEASIGHELSDLIHDLRNHEGDHVAHNLPWNKRPKERGAPNYRYQDLTPIENAPWKSHHWRRIEGVMIEYDLHTLADFRQLTNKEILAGWNIGKSTLAHIREILDETLL